MASPAVPTSGSGSVHHEHASIETDKNNYATKCKCTAKKKKFLRTPE